MRHLIVLVIVVFVATIVVSGCRSSSNLSGYFFGLPLNYTAIGASDAVGIGASVPCGAQTPTNPACPGGTGYVPDLARALASLGFAVTLVDLGISAAVLSQNIQNTGNTYDPSNCMPRTNQIPGNFITNEVPSVPGNSTIITVFAGGNDTNALTVAAGCIAAAGGNPTTFIAQQIAVFGTDFTTLITQLKQRAPGVTIVVANLPNFKYIPVGQAQSVNAQALLQALSVGIDQQVLNKLVTQGIPVVDLLCDTRSYQAMNFATDGFHPNDSGYAILAALMQSAILSASTYPAPKSSCAPYSSVGSIPLTGPFLPINLPRY